MSTSRYASICPRRAEGARGTNSFSLLLPPPSASERVRVILQDIGANCSGIRNKFFSGCSCFFSFSNDFCFVFTFLRWVIMTLDTPTRWHGEWISSESSASSSGWNATASSVDSSRETIYFDSRTPRVFSTAEKGEQRYVKATSNNNNNSNVPGFLSR